MKGNLIIISSPSGGGKGTLIKEVLRSVSNIGYSVSLTTRAPRGAEVDGMDYFFVGRDEFENRIQNGEFLEYAEVHGQLYGTSLNQTERIIAQGRDVILEIDVQGAALVRAKMADAVSIFILPPSFEVLRARLKARATENPADLLLRLRNAFDEVRQYDKFRYVIINDEVVTASQRLAAIIIAERQRRDRQNEAIQVILDSFDVSKLKTTGDLS